MNDEQARQRVFLEIAHDAVIQQASRALAEDLRNGEGYAQYNRYSEIGVFSRATTILHAVDHLPEDMPLHQALSDLLDHLDDKIKVPLWYARDLGALQQVRHPLPKREKFLWHVRHTVVAAFNFGNTCPDGEKETRDFSPNAMASLLADAAKVSLAIPDALTNEDAAGEFCAASGLGDGPVKKYPKWVQAALS